jgi:hypothetical protein
VAYLGIAKLSLASQQPTSAQSFECEKEKKIPFLIKSEALGSGHLYVSSVPRQSANTSSTTFQEKIYGVYGTTTMTDNTERQ